MNARTGRPGKKTEGFYSRLDEFADDLEELAFDLKSRGLVRIISAVQEKKLQTLERDLRHLLEEHSIIEKEKYNGC